MAKKVKKPTAPTKNPTITAKMDREALKATLRSARWENKELEEQLRQLREAHDNLKIQFADLETERKNLGSLIQQLTVEIERYQKHVQTQKETIERLENNLAEIGNIENENEKLRDANLKLTGAREVLMEIIEEHVAFR